ncbi:MAG TPA: hypothetical protein VGV38_10190 [Pyrinomonadaceae bacterium]|nr:hypothetical protein [Pyrinomonadaceae bacterium]
MSNKSALPFVLAALLCALVLSGCGSSRSSSSSSTSTNTPSYTYDSSDASSTSSNTAGSYDSNTSVTNDNSSDEYSASYSDDEESGESAEYEENVEELSEAEVDEELSEADLQRLLALARQLQAAQAQSADAARKAACTNALARLNAHLSNTSAVLGDSNTYYVWEAGFRQLQLEVNTKCKAAPGEATIYPYSGSGTSGGSLSGYAAGVESRIQQQKMVDRVQRAEELRRENAIRAGELDPNPYGGSRP